MIFDDIPQLIATKSYDFYELCIATCGHDRCAVVDGKSGQGRFEYFKRLERAHRADVPKFDDAFDTSGDDLWDIGTEVRTDNPRTVFSISHLLNSE